MPRDLSKRLQALESEQEQARVRFPEFTLNLMRAYATDEELAEWEAAGFPPITRAQFERALEQVYATTE